MEGSLPAVLIISPDNHLSSQFINILCNKSDQKENIVEYEKKEKALQTHSSLMDLDYNLDTKYYTAKVRFVTFSYAKLMQIIQNEELEYLEALGVKSVEGIIFLLDFANNKKEGLNEYTKYNKDIVTMHSPNMIISYVNRPDTDNADLFETLTFEENEYFIEIIDSDITNEPKQKTAISEDNRLQDKVGIDRVIEALECNMWSNMIKKNKATSEPKPIFDSAQIKAELMKKIALSQGDISILQNQEKPKPVESKEEKKDEDYEERQGYVELVDKEEKNEKINEKPSDQKSEIKEDGNGDKLIEKIVKENKNGDDFDVDKFEDNEESFSKIFDSMKSLKEQGKNMSDEQRRDRAAELITQLMASFQGDDFGDDDDDDDTM